MDTRPVWLTREQRDWFEGYMSGDILRLVAAWDAAPADATEAVIAALWPSDWLDETEGRYREAARLNADAVLAALGAPKATP